MHIHVHVASSIHDPEFHAALLVAMTHSELVVLCNVTGHVSRAEERGQLPLSGPVYPTAALGLGREGRRGGEEGRGGEGRGGEGGGEMLMEFVWQATHTFFSVAGVVPGFFMRWWGRYLTLSRASIL